LSFGPAAKPILKGEDRLTIVLPPKREKRRRADRDSGPADPLFDALRERRRALAKAQGVPPYVIFHDATLREMVAEKPQDRDALARISGVGARKLDDYGDAFLEVIRTF
jgi:ATP-dependent DNA helicase RecQ